MQKIRPLGRRVVVKRIYPKEYGMLLLPEERNHPPREAEILEASPDCRYVRKGDRVVLDRYSSTDFDWYGDTIVICHEDEILLRRSGRAIQVQGPAEVHVRQAS